MSCRHRLLPLEGLGDGLAKPFVGFIMTGNQSRTLNVGDRVCWHTDKNDLGTVTEKNWAGVTVKWDSRGEQAIHHNDMAQVERVLVKTK